MITGSTTAAAEQLHTSQPNISRSIAQLEQAIGLKLFDRIPGKLFPSDDGRRFFKEVQRSFSGLRQLEDAAKRIRRFSGGSLTIAAVQMLALGVIPRTVKRFVRDYPEVNLSIHTGHSSAVTQWVDDQTCDIGLVSQLSETPGVESHFLYEVDAVCVLPRDHRLATMDVIVPKDLAGEPYISLPRNEYGYTAIDAVFDEFGINRQINLETSYSSITCSLVAQGLGVAIINPLAALDFRQDEIVSRPFKPSIKHSAHLIHPTRKTDNRMISSFVATLRSVLQEDLGISSPAE